VSSSSKIVFPEGMTNPLVAIKDQVAPKEEAPKAGEEPAPGGETPKEEPAPGETGAGCVEDPMAVTNFNDREAATVNGIAVEVQVRGKCPQPLFYSATGVAKGANYMLHLPKGWVALTASVSAAVQANGGAQKDFSGCPYVVITGPFDGSVGLYEGAIRIVTSEWADGLTASVLPIHSQQCGFSVTPTAGN
jgi:hypothetical protein